MPHPKRMNHEDALEVLQNYADVKVRFINGLARLSLLYVQETGLKLNACPVVEQSAPIIGDPKSPILLQFRFVLSHECGVRSIVLRVLEKRFLRKSDILTVEDCDPESFAPVKERLSIAINAKADAKSPNRWMKRVAKRFRDDYEKM